VTSPHPSLDASTGNGRVASRPVDLRGATAAASQLLSVHAPFTHPRSRPGGLVAYGFSEAVFTAHASGRPARVAHAG
jgi:hypothetical protein